MKIVVVCEGNTCRSPLIAALLKKELPDLNISSAGVHAEVGDPVSKPIREFDPSLFEGFKAQQLSISPDDLNDTWYICVTKDVWASMIRMEQQSLFRSTSWPDLFGKDLADPAVTGDYDDVIRQVRRTIPFLTGFCRNLQSF